MGARVSAEMRKAQHMVEVEGKSAYEAAAATGISRGAISKAAWYRDYKARQPPVISTQQRARDLVVTQGLTAYEAAQRLGIAQSTISRAHWYREHIEQLKEPQK